MFISSLTSFHYVAAMLGEDISLAIAGNKVDLERERRVDVQMAEE